jgi:hypothetical protein
MIRIGQLAALLLASAITLSPPPAQAAEVGGVDFADRLPGEPPLELRGAAVLRYMALLRVYAAALWVGEGVDSGLVLEDVPKRLEIEYFRAFSAEQFAESTRVKIAENVSPEEYAHLEPRIEELNQLYRSVQPGDRYAITYLPGRGVQLAFNGAPLGWIEGADFGAAMFSIWLGREPLDDALKRRLLAR